MAVRIRLGHGVNEDDLAWLRQVVWGQPGPGDERLSKRHVVAPSTSRPWLVLPWLGLVPTVRVALDGWGRLSDRHRMVRLLGVARAALAPTRPASTVDLPSAPPLMLWLSDHLGARVFGAVIVGAKDPNRKPTVQVVNRAGDTVGWAKVGWSAATRGMVLRERAMLDRIGPKLDGEVGLRVPGVVAGGAVGDLEVLVTRPMPRRSKRWRVDPTPSVGLIRAVAEVSSATGLQERPAGDLPVWDELATRVAAVADLAPTASAAVQAALKDAVASTPPATPVTTGGWHGDLAPWNLARNGGDVWLWDWEHAGDGRPLGLDLLHYRLVVDLNVHRTDPETALRSLLVEAPDLLRPLGVREHAAHAVTIAYLAERWLRAAELVRHGAPWDTAVHPAIPDVLLSRRTEP